MSNAAAIILRPTRHGWAVCLTDGRQLARFRGPGAETRALRYLARITRIRERRRVPASAGVLDRLLARIPRRLLHRA